MFFVRILVMLLLVCLGYGIPLSGYAGDIQNYRLPNGLTVLVKEDARFPLVSVRLFVKAGSAWERPEEAGMSHLLEHMVFKGSKTSGEGVDKRVENAGGSMNAYTSYDMTTYLTDLPSSQWKNAMIAVRDLAFDPLLKQDDLNAEREVVIAEKKQRGDSPMTKLFQTALAQTLKGTPYEFPVIGNEETLRKITPDMMKDYIYRRYDPRDMVLAVVGNIQTRAVLDEAERLFGAYQNHNILSKPSAIDPSSLVHGLQVNVQEGPWNKVFVAMSFPLPGMIDNRNAATDVLSRLLAGDDTSLLPRKLRIEESIVDSVSVSAMNFERTGILLVLAQMDSSHVKQYVQTMTELLSTLTSSAFTSKQLERAKLNIEDDYLRNLENIANIAETLGAEYFYDPASVGGKQYLASVHAVDGQQIQQALETWIRPDALSISVLMPKSDQTSQKTEIEIIEILKKNWSGIEKIQAEKEDVLPTSSVQSEIIDLGQGRTLVLLPDSSLPYISVSMSFWGGELLASDEQEGLAALTATTLTTGTEKRSFADINEFLADRASGLSAGSGAHTFTLQMDIPSKFSSDMLAVFQEILKSPAFRKEDIEREKREQAASIVRKKESAAGLLGHNLMHFLFQKGAYAHRSGGEPERILRYSQEDVLVFWKKQSGQPWVLAVAGDFDRKQIEKFARELSGSSKSDLSIPASEWNKERLLELKLPERDQAVYLMLFPTVGRDSADSAGLRLLSEALSGFTGKLYQELREKRSLGYSVFPQNWTGKDTGYFAFGIIASPNNLGEARTCFAEIVKGLKDSPLPQETLDRAIAVAEADYYRSRQSRANRAGEAANLVLTGRNLDFRIKQLEEMKKVDAAQIQALAKKYLDMDKVYELTVTP